MAQSYGCSESEKEMIRKSPFNIQNCEDLEKIQLKLQNQLKERREIFNKALPERISAERKSLDKLIAKEQKLIREFDLLKQKLKNQLKERKEIFDKGLPRRMVAEKKKLQAKEKDLENINRKLKEEIGSLENNLKKHKKDRKWLSVFVAQFKLLKLKYLPDKKEVNRANKEIQKQRETLEEWKNAPGEIFNKEQKELIKEIEINNRPETYEITKIKKFIHQQKAVLSDWINRPSSIFEEEQRGSISELEELEKFKKTPHYSGAMGEVRVLKELSELGDDYHILCGLNVELDKYISYNGDWNLKTAQMDFVIVCPKGVFVIEVKNWSSRFYNQNTNLSPYEQVGRAGRVLYVYLKSELGTEVGVKPVLIPIQNNIHYNEKYRFVSVFNLYKFKSYLENKPDVLEDYEVQQIVQTLKPLATYP
jgi:hypothetical protein